MNYYTFNELANNIGCNTYRELTSGKITVHRKGRTIGTIYPGIGQVKLATRFLPPKEAELIVRLITEFSSVPDEHRFAYYVVQHISGLYVKEYKEDGDDIKIVFTKSKLSAANKLTATDREKIMEHKLGDTFAVVECDD